jgi:hypothetical protein
MRLVRQDRRPATPKNSGLTNVMLDSNSNHAPATDQHATDANTQPASELQSAPGQA